MGVEQAQENSEKCVKARKKTHRQCEYKVEVRIRDRRGVRIVRVIMLSKLLQPALIAGLLVAYGVPAGSQDALDTPKATLLAALEANYSRVDAVTCQFEMRTRQTKAGRELARSLRPDAPDQAESGRRYQLVVWKAKPHANMFRYDIEVRDGDALVQKKNVTFDGTQGATYSDGGTEKTRSATVWSKPPGALSFVHTAPSAMSGGLVYLFDLPLHRVLATAESLSDADKVRVGDIECRRLVAEGCSYSPESRYTVRVDLDPLASFAVRQLEMHDEKSGRTLRLKAVALADHKLPSGETLPFPTAITVEFWDQRFDEPVNVTEVHVKELSLAPALQKSDFQIAFPPGTVVMDMDRRKNFVVGDTDDELARRTAEQALEELRKKQGTPDRARPPSLSYGPSIFAGIVALCVGAFVIWLRRR